MCLPNVESEGLQILGAISLSGDPLLSSLQLGVGAGLPFLPGQAGQTLPPPVSQTLPPQLEQTLPVFGNPSSDQLPAGTPAANVQ